MLGNVFCCFLYWGWIGVQLPQGYSHFEEAIYFLPLSSQELLVLILSTSQGWKTESTLEPPSDLNTGPLDWHIGGGSLIFFAKVISFLVYIRFWNCWWTLYSAKEFFNDDVSSWMLSNSEYKHLLGWSCLCGFLHIVFSQKALLRRQQLFSSFFHAFPFLFLSCVSSQIVPLLGCDHLMSQVTYFHFCLQMWDIFSFLSDLISNFRHNITQIIFYHKDVPLKLRLIFVNVNQNT